MNREATKRQVRLCWSWCRALGEPGVEAHARTHSLLGGTPRRHELGRDMVQLGLTVLASVRGFRWKRDELG